MLLNHLRETVPEAPFIVGSPTNSSSLVIYWPQAALWIGRMTGLGSPKKAFWSEAVSDPSRELVSFYSDTGPDCRGRFLREIQNWSDDELELIHDYIQWLFPLAERSSFNLNAPILNAYTINRFRSDVDLRRRLETSLVRMLAFYGLEMRATVPLRVACAESFPQRAENWLTPSNHNHLRITRILKSLCLLGLEDQASAFFRFLEVLYKMESTRPHPRISIETFGYWRLAVDAD